MDTTANEPDGTMDNMKKENEELKHELKIINDSNRAWNVIVSIFLGVFIGFVFMIFAMFAYTGAWVIATEMHLSEFWVSLIGAFLNTGSKIVLIYIVWHVLFVVYYNFEDEINEAFHKFNLRLTRAIRSFNKAYNDPIKEDE